MGSRRREAVSGRPLTFAEQTFLSIAAVIVAAVVAASLATVFPSIPSLVVGVVALAVLLGVAWLEALLIRKLRPSPGTGPWST